MGAVQLPEPDHVILGCSDLKDGVAYMEELCGYHAGFGGAHPGRGTHNALLKLGYKTYLEILAPDPKQPELKWHQHLPELQEPVLVGWAIAVKNIEQYAVHLLDRGVACAGPTPGSRVAPGGQRFRWKTLVLEDDQQGILPFYIEWAHDSEHPAASAAGACVLNRWTRTGQLLAVPPPGLEYRPVPMADMPDVQLHATIGGRHGEFELKSRAIPSAGWSKPTG